MTFTVNLTDRANRWIVPGSNQHRILNYTRDSGMYESEAARLFGMHQGFHTDTMFDFMFNYKLTDDRGHRWVAACNDRGRAVADLLDSGVAVNLKNMKTDTKRAQVHAEKPTMEKCRAVIGSHKYAIIRHLFNNGASKSIDVVNAIGFSQADHTKYCKVLKDCGLITMIPSGATYELNITELGRTEFAEVVKGEPKHYLTKATKIVEDNLKEFNESFDMSVKVFGNRARHALAAARHIFGNFVPEHYGEYAGVNEVVAAARAHVVAKVDELSALVDAQYGFEERSDTMRAYYQKEIGKDIMQLKNCGVELKLAAETKAALLSAKLTK